MMEDSKHAGYAVVRSVIAGDELEGLREEANRVASEAGTICVRQICERSRRFRELALSEHLAVLLSANMKLVRSILFDKTPDENWPVAWHQDLTIAVMEKVETDGYGPWSVKNGVVHVQPPSEVLEKMVTLRVHLDDAPETNGALRVIPGSSVHGKMDPSQIKKHIGEEVVCACRAGDVLMMSPLILHASKRSASPARRRILHFEYAPADSLDEKLSWGESGCA